ncbi:PAAR domain-containing protein [Geofilum rubicundum]
MCVCTGPPDTIMQGEPTVLMNGTPVATMGSMTAHGGSIAQGEPTVLISSATPNKKAFASLADIPVPTFSKIEITINKFKDASSGNEHAKKMTEAQANQELVKEEAKQHGYLSDLCFSQ